MKSPSILLVACAGLALARDPPSDDEMNRQAAEICARMEKIDVDKCKRDAKKCVTSALDRKVASEIERGDDVFWSHIRQCTVFSNLNADGDTPKNFVAAFGDDGLRFVCDPPANGSDLDCVFISKDRVAKDCVNQDCRIPRELPDVCAKSGGCETCEHGASFRSEGSLEDKFPGADPFSCILRQNKDGTTQPAPTIQSTSTIQSTPTAQPAPPNKNQCNDVRMQTFRECRQRRPDDFDACVKEGQDAFVKCEGSPVGQNRQNTLTTSTRPAPTQPAPPNQNQCNDIRMQTFTECRQRKPDDFDACVKEGQDAFVKCEGSK
ncbi:hypothetical protein J3459_014204 [Metarhizium acridum]|nr:hypothetical protein J3459_014204 [Metarhizium acridum]